MAGQYSVIWPPADRLLCSFPALRTLPLSISALQQQIHDEHISVTLLPIPLILVLSDTNGETQSLISR